MKRILLILIVIALGLSMASCGRELVAETLLCDFLSAYGAGGTVYSPLSSEGEDGYVDGDMMSKIYIHEGAFPENYAVLLNSRADYGAECAVFVCKDKYESARVMEICRERISLLGKTEGDTVIYRSGNIIFYSTFDDIDNVERIWIKIIKSHT